MKCSSCETEIDPKWQFAISNNICPFCGNALMDELLKKLLSTLQDTFTQLQSYQDELNDWLHSNYSYVNVNSPNLEKYLPKHLKVHKRNVDKTTRQEDDSILDVQDQEKTNSFFERAEATKSMSKQKDLKSLANKIRKEGVGSNMITAEDIEEAASNGDQEAIEFDVGSMISNSKALSGGIVGLDDIESPFAGMTGNNQSNAKDMKYLRDLQNRSENAKESVLSGVSSSGKKSSFSRA